MAFSTSNRHWLLLVMCTILFTCKLGKAAHENGGLGAAGVVAEEYVHQAEEDDGGDAYETYPEPGGEGVHDPEPGGEGVHYPQPGGEGVHDPEPGGEGVHYPQPGGEGVHYPQPGGEGVHEPGLVLDKVIECFNDKHIYSSCDEAYRLTEHGYLNVPPEYTDEYCYGPCLTETNHVLDCIDGILLHFVFYNKATVHDIRETVKEGCSYGPKRGNFDVLEHIKGDGAITNKISSSLLLIILGWNVLF